MSILEILEKHRTSGALFLLEPVMPDESPVRTIFVSPELHAQITGPWKTREAADRFGWLRGDLDHYVTGGHISMHLDPHAGKKSKAAREAYLGLLDHPKNGIFDIRSRHPSPALRVLGGFAAKDIFVAVKCHPRSRKVGFLDLPPLGDRTSPAWALAIGTCMEQWACWFGDHAPVTGSDANVYLSEPKSVVE